MPGIADGVCCVVVVAGSEGMLPVRKGVRGHNCSVSILFLPRDRQMSHESRNLIGREALTVLCLSKAVKRQLVYVGTNRRHLVFSNVSKTLRRGESVLDLVGNLLQPDHLFEDGV
jgi:hypothetical protein